MSEYLDNLVKCFNNSDLGVNLTIISILDDKTNEFEPYFIAKEVATILGYENAKKAITDHVDELDKRMLSYDECKELFENYENTKLFENNESFSGEQNVPPKNPIKINSQGMKLINEAGLYTLVIKSDKPEAKPFRRWVTSEVLPSIRKTGSYSIQKQLPTTYLEALESLVESVKREEQLRLANETLTQELDHAIKTKSQINDKRTASLMGKTGALTKENTRLKVELETANNSVKQLTAERDIALLGLYNSKEVSVSLKNKYPFIKYAEKTLRTKVSKALKTISLALGESIRDQPNPKDPSYAPTPYFTKRTVDQLFECIERDSNYLKSFK